jgi:hypothetical protein
MIHFCRTVGRSMKRILILGLGALLAFSALAGAQTWTPLNHQPSFGASTALLLTDGTVMVQSIESSIWWRLTPDNTGSYVNGTWTQLASMPAGYAPLYYASAVLPDGRVVVVGGEYNNPGGQNWTNQGAIYNPATNTWTSLSAPAGWSQIGDAQSVVLANGTFMMAHPFSTQSALLNPSSLTWTLTGTATKADQHDEEGWTLLPNGKVLAIDTNNPSDLTHSELYDPATGNWSYAGSTLVKLPDTNPDGSGSHEIGPAVLRPNGTVFATGGTSSTAIYNTATGTWSVGPTFSGVDVADGPAALLPSGNVLVDASPGVFGAGAQFFEFNGTSLISVPGPPRAPFQSSYEGRMLVLPTGQILFTDGSSDVEIYTASGTYQIAWPPNINSFPSSVYPGTAGYVLTGTQLNGLSQGAMYGDDAQSATNYPLIRITNNATGHVFYTKTHNHSTMAVATGGVSVSTQFDVPAGIENGPSQLVVVANGIPSIAVAVQVGNPVNYAGYFDHAGCDTLAGWAADRNRLNTSITASFYDNGVLFATVLANLSRPDVGAFLGDNGLHGFSFATPARLRDGATHMVSARFENSGTELGASPVSLTCPLPVANFSFACTSLSCSFDGTSSTGTGLTYAWTFGDSTTGTGSTTGHTYGASGSDTVTLTVTNSLGQQSIPKSKKVSVIDETPVAAESFFAVPPCRIADTRTTTPLSSGVQRAFQVAGLCAIPASAKAVAFNVTVVSPTGAGFLVFGNPTFGPFTQASINFDAANSPRANSAILRLGTGSVNVNPYVAASPGQVQMILDVYGYFSEDTSPASGAQGPFGFQTLTPCRIADTRTSTPLAVNTTRNFTVQGVCGVPAGASAALLNLAVVSPTAGGQASLFQAGAFPPVPTINFNAGMVLANGAKILLAPATPDVSVNYYSPTAGASTHALIDVFGYFKPDAPLKYRPITACRVVDTRFADQGGPMLGAPETRNFQIRGNCGVPASAKAVAVNITSVGAAGPGFLIAYPSGGAMPAASYLNFDPSQGALGNGGIVALSTQSNDLAVTTANSTHVIIDVFGYFQ